MFCYLLHETLGLLESGYLIKFRIHLILLVSAIRDDM